MLILLRSLAQMGTLEESPKVYIMNIETPVTISPF